jgi:hypothetical protein
MSRRTGLAALAALALVGLVTTAAAGGAERPRFDTRVLALVPFPGYPARAYVHPNGRIYEGTYESDAGAGVPSRVFEYTGSGGLLRSFTIDGQDLGSAHGIQVALSDSRGSLVLLDTGPPRVLMLDPDTGRQRTYARFRDLPVCGPGAPPGDCSVAADDGRPAPNYAAWGPDGSLYVTDFLQAVVWRVPPGGGRPEVWIADRKLDGTEFGTTGIALTADRGALLIGQGSSAGGGGGNPSTGKIYRVPIRANGEPGTLTKVWESGPTDLPDGFAIARSGNLYVPLAGTTAQIAVVSPEGEELERFPDAPFTGDNGSAVPFDTPSSVMFLGTRLIVANQSAIAGDATHQAILDVEAGERGLAPLVPKRAGFARPGAACVVRKLSPRGPRRPAGRPHRHRGACTVHLRLAHGRYGYRLRSGGGVAKAGNAHSGRGRRLTIRIRAVEKGSYTLVVAGHGERRRLAIRVLRAL